MKVEEANNKKELLGKYTSKIESSKIILMQLPVVLLKKAFIRLNNVSPWNEQQSLVISLHGFL